MKKLYTLALLALTAVSMNAQNLVTNPTFDNGLTGWTAGFVSSYTLPTLVAADGSDGANSVNYVPTATTGFFQDVPVTAGSTIKISFWYKSTGDDSDSRLWSNYKAADGTTVIYQVTDVANDPLRTNNGWLPTAAAWTKYELTVVVPANAATLTFAVRAYTGGTVSFDQFSVEANPLSVKDNAIAGLKVYPNPVTKGNLYVSSNSNEVKAVAVYDVLGKQVVKATTTSNEAINVSNLNAGVYIVKITEAGKTATRKLVIE